MIFWWICGKYWATIFLRKLPSVAEFLALNMVIWFSKIKNVLDHWNVLQFQQWLRKLVIWWYVTVKKEQIAKTVGYWTWAGHFACEIKHGKVICHEDDPFINYASKNMKECEFSTTIWKLLISTKQSLLGCFLTVDITCDTLSSKALPKNSRTIPSTEKVIARMFWDSKRILLINYLEKCQSINRIYYDVFWKKWKLALVKKSRNGSKCYFIITTIHR